MSAEPNATDYTAIEEWRMPGMCGDDGAAWAAAYCQHAKKLGIDVDEGWMIGWFANAIEASWEARTRRAQPPTKPILRVVGP